MKDLVAAWICIVIGGGLFALHGPSVARDYFLDADTLVRAPGYEITEARCKASFFVLSQCDVEAKERATGDETRFGYLIFGSFGGEEVFIQQSADGSYLTTNIGVENARNRWWMLCVFGGMMLLGGIFLLTQRAEERRVKKGR